MANKGKPNLNMQELSFGLDQVPYAEDYFYADRGRVTLVGDQLIFSFSSITTIEKESSLCVEIVMPIEVAINNIYKSNFIEPSLSGEKMAFVVKAASDKLKTIYKFPEDLSKVEYPKEGANFRKFSSNFMHCALVQGQACMEFYQVPPRMLIDKMFKQGIKREGRISSVISVISSTFLLDYIFTEAEIVLKPLYRE